MRKKRNNSVPESVQVTFTGEDIQRMRARLEFGQQVLRSPPNEDSDEMRALRQMLPSELEAEARQLQLEMYDHRYTAIAYGQVDGYSTQFRREYRLKIVKHVMGDEWFGRVVAHIHTEGTQIIRELEHRRDQPRACGRCGEKFRFEYLVERFCEECWERDPEACREHLLS